MREKENNLLFYILTESFLPYCSYIDAVFCFTHRMLYRYSCSSKLLISDGVSPSDVPLYRHTMARQVSSFWAMSTHIQIITWLSAGPYLGLPYVLYTLQLSTDQCFRLSTAPVRFQLFVVLYFGLANNWDHTRWLLDSKTNTETL